MRKIKAKSVINKQYNIIERKEECDITYWYIIPEHMNSKEIYSENNKIGFAIQYFRKKYHISQNKLCKGLCSAATLSRIESGERDADAFLLETLLERMGQSPNKFELILTEDDKDFIQRREEIQNQLDKKEFTTAYELLSTYNNLVDSGGNVHKQFVKRTEAQLNELQGGTAKKTVELLNEAIIFTVPDFKTHNIKDYYLSNTELNIK